MRSGCNRAVPVSGSTVSSQTRMITPESCPVRGLGTSVRSRSSARAVRGHGRTHVPASPTAQAIRSARVGVDHWEIPLFEREGELRRLHRWVGDLVQGRGRVGLVEGEAGIGKSVLVRDLASYAAKCGIQVLQAAGDEIEADRPFGVVLDALACAGDRSAQAAAVVASARTGTPETTEWGTFRFRLNDDAVEAFEGLSLDGPVLVVVEDVHWADASSVGVMHRLARLCPATALLVVVTARLTPRSIELQRLADSLGEVGDVLSLGPLSTQSATELAQAILRTELGPTLAGKLKSTGGNPLFVRELVETLDREGLVLRDNDRADVAAELLPPSLRLTILRRVGFLSRPTMEVLRVASVMGTTFEVHELAVVLDSTATTLLPALEEAVASRVLVGSGERMSFAHDLVRAAIYEDLPLGVRRALHAQAGHTLARWGAPLSQVAAHLTLGAVPGDAEAVGWLRRAAREAAPKAPGIAAELLMHARELAGPVYAERTELAAELVRWLVFSQRFAEGERVARELLAEGATGAIAWEVSRDLGVALCFQGRRLEGIQVFEAVLADPSLPDSERAVFLAEMASARAATWPEDPTAGERAAHEAQQARAIAARLGHRIAAALALNAGAYAEWVRGNLTRAAELAVEATGLSGCIGAELQMRSPHAVLSGVLRDAERGEEAEEVAKAARRLAEELGDVLTLRTMLVQDGLYHLRTAQWEDAVRELEAALALAEEHGLRRHPMAIAPLAYVAIHRGDLTRAAAFAAELSDADPFWSLWIRPLLTEAQGDLDGAVGLLAKGQAAHFRLLSALGLLLELSRVCVSGGGKEQLAELSRIADEAAHRLGTNGAAGTALYVKGLAASDATLLLKAVETLRRTPWVLLRALVCEDAARALARSDRRGEALELVREALGVYEAAGAPHDVRRAEALARSLGAPRGVRGERRRPATGWDSLTETEVRVLELVGQGLTNRAIGDRLFISRRTVESHMAHIFRKVQVSSRAELAAAVGRRG